MQQTCHLDDQQRWEKHMLRAGFQQWIANRAAARSTTTCVLPIWEARSVISTGADAVLPSPTAHLEASMEEVGFSWTSEPPFCSAQVLRTAPGVRVELDLRAVSVTGPQGESARQNATRRCICRSHAAKMCSWKQTCSLCGRQQLRNKHSHNHPYRGDFLIRRQWFSSFPVLLWSAGLTRDARSARGGSRNQWSSCTLKLREKCSSRRRFGMEWGEKVWPLHVSQQIGKIWQEKLWSSICCRGKPSQIQTKALVQAQENAVISRDETLAGRRSSSPAQLNVAAMRIFSHLRGRMHESKLGLLQ